MNEEYQKAKQEPPRQPIDEYSYKMGRAETLDACLKSIEEAMFNLAPQYEDKEKQLMFPVWNDLVYLKDSITTTLRKNMKLYPYHRCED
jgi:hypothetical protein